MVFRSKEKESLMLTLLLFFLFLGILGLNIFVIKFGEKKIISKIEEIKKLESQLKNIDKENQTLNLISPSLKLIENNFGKDLISLASDFKQKEIWKVEELKNFILERAKTKNWQVEKEMIDNNKLLYLNLIIPEADWNSFLNFLEKEILILRLVNLKVEKVENNFRVSLIFK